MNTANMRSSIVCFLFFACLTSAYPKSRSDKGIASTAFEDTLSAEVDGYARKEFFSLRDDESLSWKEKKEKLRQWAYNVDKVEEMENHLVMAEKDNEAWAESLKNAVDMLKEKVSSILEIIRNDDISKAKLKDEIKNIVEESPVAAVLADTFQRITEMKRNTRSVDVALQDDDREESTSQVRHRVRRGCRKPNGDFCRWPMNCDWFCNH